MPKFLRAASPIAAPLVSLVLLALPFSSIRAHAQTTTRETPLERQLGRIDFAISAAGMFSNTVSGVEKRDASGSSSTITSGTVTTSTTTTPVTLAIHPSSTVGEIATLRYTAKPYFGLEFNFSNVRLTQNYTFTGSTTTKTTNSSTNPPSVTTTTTPVPNYLPGGAQTAMREMTFGYIAHLPYRPFGIQPFAGAGAGTTRFRPTTFGGEGLPQQYRATYYWTVGVEDNFPGSHFGVRLAYRELYYLGPDFLENYLTILKRVHTADPTIGFFVRF